MPLIPIRELMKGQFRNLPHRLLAIEKSSGHIANVNDESSFSIA